MILLIGVVLAPLTLTLVFNSYDVPDAGAYVRMAFAQVAGATIAICTAIGLLAHRVVRRGPRESTWLAVLAAVFVAWQVTNISAAARFLLTGLGLTG